MRPSAASRHANPAPPPLPLSFFSSAVQRSQQPPHQYQPQPLNRLYAGQQASDPYEELIHESRARPFVPPPFHSQMQNHEYGHGQQQWQYNREADLTPGSVSRGNSGLSYAADRYDEYGYPPAYTRDSTGMTSLASGRYGEFGSGFGGGYEGNSSSYDQMPARRQPTNQQPGSQDPIAFLLNARKRREEATSFFNPPIPRPLLPSLADANPPTMFGSKPNPFAAPSASAYGQPPNHYAEDVLHGLPQSQPLYSRTTFATAQQAGLQPSMRLTSGGELLHDLRNGNRLKKLLGAPENKELWLETRTGSSVGGITQIDNPLEEDRLYYYNPVTLQVTFDKPSPMNSHLMPQSECQKLLDMMTPSTLIVKRIFRQLTAEKLRSHFEQYGPVAFTKVCRYKDLAKASSKAGASRNLVYFRMETVQAQNKILEKSFHLLEGHEVEVRIPANRIFIGRVPDRTSPIELVRFFSQEVAKMDPSAYCVDAYLPLPYRQFAFCTVGGPSMAPKLALKADFFFHGVSITVSTCHTESQVDAERLFERKVQNLVDHNELARVRALQSIAVEVKFLLQILGKMKKFNSQRMLLAEINNQFLKCTEEKLRNYLSIQEHVLDICQLVAMKGDDLDEHNLFKRKRQRLANTAEEEGGENDGDEEEEEEEENFDEDETAKKLVSQSSDQFVISSTSMAKSNQQPSSSEEATTHIVKILTKG